MGLAASQARLLTITARKADCEFISMNLSHQKLALARDMEYVSTEYQKALDMTKLVYDYYGTGTSRMDLTYGLLMEPSVYNDYYPKLVTDMTNRVILTSPYAAAARAAGIPAEGLLGTPSSDIRNKFIDALTGNGIITKTVSDAVKSIPYNNRLGLGGGIEATTGFNEMSYSQFIDEIKARCTDTMGYGLTLGSEKDTVDASGVVSHEWNNRAEYFTKYDNSGTREEIAHGSANGGSVSLYDLLCSDSSYILSMESGNAERTPIVAAAFIQSQLVGSSEKSASFLNWMMDQFSTVLGGVNANDTALQYAYNSVFDLLCPTNNLQVAANAMADRWDGATAHDQKHYTEPGREVDDGKIPGYTYGMVMDEVGTHYLGHLDDGYYSGSEKYASEYLGFTYSADRCHSGGESGQTSEVYINLNNIARTFLTAYVQFMQGLDNSKYSWNVGKLSDCNLFNPKQDDFTFIVAGETEVDTGDSDLYANFYDTLFNRICMNGWTENAKIEDKEYMQEMLKNGMAFISSINDDGFYYQGNYSIDRTILEVKDEDAIAKAQAKYNTEKAKIENKEDTIDMKMKNLDTEISSLTTEYDTVKQLIGKTVEKSFKRYEA